MIFKIIIINYAGALLVVKHGEVTLSTDLITGLI